MSRYHLTEPATRDLQGIYDYIALGSLSAAGHVLDELTGRFQRLAEMPGMGRERPELITGLRSFPQASFLIFYRETAEGIEILRVLHGARDIDPTFFA